MLDLKAARAVCDRTVVAFEPEVEASVPVDRATHVRAAFTAVARCRALLIGIVDLDRSDRADIVGVLLRAMLEAWYFGVIVLLGDADDLERLDADNRWWSNRLAGVLDLDPEDGPAGKFTVYQRASRAGELVGSIGENPDSPVEWYRELYAGESLTSAHAGPASMSAYLEPTAGGNLAINLDPELDTRLRYGRLLLGATLCITLGRWTYERAGLDTSALDAIDIDET